MQFLGHRRLSFFLLLALLSAIPKLQIQSQVAQTPYIYYFSDILHSFVIEQPDGSDSHQFAEGIIPESHNSVKGAGWSPSGQWFAFTSYRTTTHSFGELQNIIISTDEQVVISLPDKISSLMWSPTEDLLLYVDKTDSEALKIVLFDANLQEIVFEYEMDGYLNTWTIYWSLDGSSISWQIFRGESIVLYNLFLPDFELTEIVVEDYDQIIYDDNGQFLLFITDENELVIHDIFSHQETRYPFDFTADTSTILVTWNPEKTQAVITVTEYQNQDALSVFWVSLSEERIELVYGDDTGSDSCSYCIYWNPSGDRAIIQTRNETFTVLTSTFQLSILDTDQRFVLWLDDNQALFAQYATSEQTQQTSIINIDTGHTEAVDLPVNLGWSSYISESGGYLLVGDYILEIPSFEIFAISQMSATTYGSTMNTNENSNWAIVEQASFYPLSGYRSINYEAVELNSTRTRELTTCYGNLCWGWLPSQVSPLQFGQSSPISLVPAPIQIISVEKPIQSVTWSEDGTQIHVISAFRDADDATMSIWDVATETIVEEYNMPYCQALSCVADEELFEVDSSPEITLPLTNNVGSLQLDFDTETQNYVIRDLELNKVLYQFDENAFPLNIGATYLWVGDILIFPANNVSDGCFKYWSQQQGAVAPAVPMRCAFSPNENFVLFMYTTPIDKTFLIDTTTGDKTLINFYARDGVFSPDGNQIALGTGYRLTIWDVSGILSANR